MPLVVGVWSLVTQPVLVAMLFVCSGVIAGCGCSAADQGHLVCCMWLVAYTLKGTSPIAQQVTAVPPVSAHVDQQHACGGRCVDRA
jgi:hypothetical protein